jgi:hypothetical protein
LNSDPHAQADGSNALLAIGQKRVFDHQRAWRNSWIRGKYSLVHVQHGAHGAVSNSVCPNPPAAFDGGDHKPLQIIRGPVQLAAEEGVTCIWLLERTRFWPSV